MGISYSIGSGPSCCCTNVEGTMSIEYDFTCIDYEGYCFEIAKNDGWYLTTTEYDEGKCAGNVTLIDSSPTEQCPQCRTNDCSSWEKIAKKSFGDDFTCKVSSTNNAKTGGPSVRTFLVCGILSLVGFGVKTL